MNIGRGLERIGVTDLRNNIKYVIDKAQNFGTQFIIERSETPVGVYLSYRDFIELVEDLEDAIIVKERREQASKDEIEVDAIEYLKKKMTAQSNTNARE